MSENQEGQILQNLHKLPAQGNTTLISNKLTMLLILDLERENLYQMHLIKSVQGLMILGQCQLKAQVIL